METEPRFIDSSDRLEKPWVKPATPGSQGKSHNHCATEASLTCVSTVQRATTLHITWLKLLAPFITDYSSQDGIILHVAFSCASKLTVNWLNSVKRKFQNSAD